MSTISKERLNKLCNVVLVIDILLEEPHPELLTWSTSLSDAIDMLCKLWYGRLP